MGWEQPLICQIPTDCSQLRAEISTTYVNDNYLTD